MDSQGVKGHNKAALEIPQRTMDVDHPPLDCYMKEAI